MSHITHVLIADNNPIFRAGVRSFLNGTHSSIKIVGEADEGENIPELIKERQPDVVLLDISLVQKAGELDMLGQICRAEDSPNVVVMTEENDITHITQSLSHGAVGVVTKDVTAPELKQVVNRAAQRQRALSSTVVDVLVDYVLQQETAPLNYGPVTIESLTERELEVFNLVAQGLSNKEIGERLSLSLGTVKSHTSNIMGKLQVNNRAQVALLAAGQLPQEQVPLKDEID
ncbi:MAG: response regulator transcription factor [Anaerolineae bacterium]|nr:response regulator transcription factor [Anaerolineae bacterium]